MTDQFKITAVITAVFLGSIWPPAARTELDSQPVPPITTGYSFQGNLQGTLDIDITSRDDRAWLFLGTELEGKLPVKKTKQVQGGDYQVRLIQFYTSSTGSECAIRTQISNVHADPGKTIDVHGDLRSWHGKNTSSPTVSCTPDKSTYSFDDNEQLKRAEADFTEAPAHDSHQWEAFLASAEWRPLSIADEQLSATPPTRRVLVQLPDTVGGPRELDIEQLQALKIWYLGLLDLYLPPRPDGMQWEKGIGIDESKAHALQKRLAELNASHAERRAQVSKLFDRIVEKLRNAAQ